MDLTTELLDTAAFREAKRGGYNTQDVDEFIEQVKVEYKQHAGLLQEARQGTDPMRARLAEAERRAAEAERRAAEASERASLGSDDDDMLKRTLVLAQRTADAAIREAEEQASRTLAAAQDQAARMLGDAREATAQARDEAEGEARRAQEEARAQVLGELCDLEAARDQLHTDVDTLERHLEEQRDRVRLSSRELQRLLDDPAALREATVPAVSDVSVPVFATTPPRVEPTPLDERHADEGAAWAHGDEAWREPESASPPSSAPHAGRPITADGPPTKPAEMPAERGDDDDAYLAELRKAMTDDAPLGPREEGDIDPRFAPGSEPNRSRFGRRR